MNESFENLSKDAQEYIIRRVDDIKMTMVEELSVMMGDVFAGMLLLIMLFVAFLFVLVAAVAALAQVIGFIYAMVLAGVAIVVAALVLYRMRATIFVNTMVRHMCRILAIRKEVGDE